MSLASKVNKAILEHEDITHLRKTIGGIMKPEFKNQKQMFEWIWDNREHISEVSNLPLIQNKNDMKWHWQFAHILPKGTYPKYKLNPDNIMLMLPIEHERQEEYEVYMRKHAKLRRQYYKEFYGKEFAE